MRRRRHYLEFLRRLMAVGGVALVLLLTALAASPELHHWFHGGDDGGSEDNCAVVLYAHGVSVAPDTAVLAATPALWRGLDRPEVAEVALAASRHLHPPGRGPPVS